MTKIEETLINHKSDIDMDNWGDQEWYKEDLVRAIKEYAEYYAKKCLEIAAENVEVSYGYSCIINKESITNIQLPKHE